SKALDRFERVTRQLADTKRTLETDITIRDSRRSESAARIQLLRDAPRESGPLFSDLLGTLQNAGWRQLPTDKNQVDQLGASIQSALVNVAVLKSADVTMPATVNVAELEATVKTLTDAERIIDRLSQEEVARRRHEAQAKLRLQQLANRMQA